MLRNFQRGPDLRFRGYVARRCRRGTLRGVFAQQGQQLLDRLVEGNFPEPPFHLCPLFALRFGERKRIGIRVLVDGGNQADGMGGVVDKLGELLNKVKFPLRLVVGGIFQKLAKLIDHHDQHRLPVGVGLAERVVPVVNRLQDGGGLRVVGPKPVGYRVDDRGVFAHQVHHFRGLILSQVYVEKTLTARFQGGPQALFQRPQQRRFSRSVGPDDGKRPLPGFDIVGHLIDHPDGVDGGVINQIPVGIPDNIDRRAVGISGHSGAIKR